MNVRAGLMGVVAAGACCSPAVAARWEVFPFGSVGGYYESNLGLNPVSGQEVQVSGAVAEAGVALQATSPKAAMTFRPYVRSTYFPGDRDFDYNNAFAELNLNYASLRSSAALASEYSHETVSSSALPGTELRGDLGDPRGGDIGTATIRSQRDSLGVYPSASFAVTQRGSIVLNGSYVDVSYDRKLPVEELGYQFARGGLGWAYELSRLSILSFNAFTEKFSPVDAPGFTPSVGSTSNGVTTRWTRSFSTKQRYYVQGGATRTKFDRVVAGSQSGSSDTGYIGGIGGIWEYQISSLFADLVHRVQPSSSGTVANQTDARVQLIRSITPRWRATLGGRAIISQAVDRNARTDDRQYSIASIAVEWRWTRRLSLVGDFEYIRQKLENQPRAANTNLVTLSVAYDAGRRN
jgi:hypothetical protein